jgi:hypothetical protein
MTHRNRSAEALAKRPWPAGKIRRNAGCPCGSGRKFKRCCGKGAACLFEGGKGAVMVGLELDVVGMGTGVPEALPESEEPEEDLEAEEEGEEEAEEDKAETERDKKDVQP